MMALRNQNGELFRGLDPEEDRLSIKYRKRSRNQYTIQVVLSVSPTLWKRITEAGNVNIDLRRVVALDQSPLVQCKRCLGYGHSKKYCSDKVDLCSHCGRHHTIDKCTERQTSSPPSCINCQRSKQEKTEHNAFSETCPLRRRWDAAHKQISNPEIINENILNKFLGILIYTSVIKFSNTRAYWSEKFGYDHIKNNGIALKKFEKIRSTLHFADDTLCLPKDHPDYDRLLKIRPPEETLNCQFGKVPLDQRLSIDEQMCATKMSHYIKQYMPNKPHKWGFKLYLICSLQGYAHRFEVYSGGGSKNNILPGEPDLGESGNTVVRLARMEQNQQPQSQFDKSKKERVAITCPKVIKEYNAHMEGVDLLDSFIGRYHITMKSRKWTMRLFYHFLDLAVINSWVMFKKVNNIKGNDQLLNLGTFRLELAETLCKLGLFANGAKQGRPSGSRIQRELVMKKFRGPAQAIPLKDVRLDQTCHWAVWLDKQQRCKFPKCSGFTFKMCQKYRVSLGDTKKSNCFYKYHNEE
ncbi:unnamed protein product [Euphydryas editha]|uniref:PiggyBac transposable element-derived protein domain-containing protein n=1 Tax=Euphydryas editha TaxID=104508 RepID=A0AAU9UWE6_EUPED|nr:unnamed protein product [Euphydryas editha]